MMPTLAPPYTSPRPRLTSSRAKPCACSMYSGWRPLFEPQYTQMF
ncbi:Uncharacterised protein [Bordetella pertussis]|nr:Uncharacterised protein [Bordetella pertussis]